MRWREIPVAVEAVALYGWPAAAQTIRTLLICFGDGDTLLVR